MAENEAGYEPDLNMSKIALIGFFGALITFVLIVVLQVVFYAFAADVIQASSINDPYTEYATLVAKQRESVNTPDYAWVDKAKGVVRIPLNRAIELTLAEANAKKGEFPSVPQGPAGGDGAAPAGTGPAPASPTPVAPSSGPASSGASPPSRETPAGQNPEANQTPPANPAPANPAPAQPAPPANPGGAAGG